MSVKKRCVILFGAGATIPWGGPTTSALTQMIRESHQAFRFINDQKSVINFIVDTLQQSGYRQTDLNFETIINVVEEFIVHHAFFDGTRKLPSLSKAFFSPILDSLKLDFAVSGGYEGHGFRLEIPKGAEYPFSESAINNERPEQMYFQHLLTLMLTGINGRISNYSYHSPGNTVIDTNEKQQLNNCFKTWYRTISQDSLIRMYTLNYDRLFKILAAKTGTHVFEGFDCGEFVEHDSVLPDVNRIVTDFYSPTHYNLHGCSFWAIHPRGNTRQLKNLRISLRPRPVLGVNEAESAVIQIDKGRNSLVSNIITGYQKSSRSFISPFRQMHAAFDQDCLQADEVKIVGYSLGDYHINASIVNALRYNQKVQLHIIDPAYCEKTSKKNYDILIDRLIHIFPDVFDFGRTDPIYSDDRDTCTYFNGKLKVTTIGFEQFLLREIR